MLLTKGFTGKQNKQTGKVYNCKVFCTYCNNIIISGYLLIYLLLLFTTKQMQERFDLTLFLSGHYNKLYTYST